MLERMRGWMRGDGGCQSTAGATLLKGSTLSKHYGGRIQIESSHEKLDKRKNPIGLWPPPIIRLGSGGR